VFLLACAAIGAALVMDTAAHADVIPGVDPLPQVTQVGEVVDGALTPGKDAVDDVLTPGKLVPTVEDTVGQVLDPLPLPQVDLPDLELPAPPPAREVPAPPPVEPPPASDPPPKSTPATTNPVATPPAVKRSPAIKPAPAKNPIPAPQHPLAPITAPAAVPAAALAPTHAGPTMPAPHDFPLAPSLDTLAPAQSRHGSGDGGGDQLAAPPPGNLPGNTKLHSALSGARACTGLYSDAPQRPG